MKVADLKDKSVLLLGLGVEGRSTFRFLRAAFPEQSFGLADQQPLESLSPEMRRLIHSDSRIRLHLGHGYLSGLSEYDVVVKSPGIPVTLPEYRQALAAGTLFTSQTALFFANCPGVILGVTGTKGKSTTASLLHAMLRKSFPRAHLLGNIGVAPLDVLGNGEAARGDLFVYELSSHQLEGLRQSPHIAILLNIVPEHLDYYDSFEQYVEAKENITRFQSQSDFLIYDSDHELPAQIAARSKAQPVACSLQRPRTPGCFLSGEQIMYRSPAGEEQPIVATRDVPLPGRFNLINVAAAAAAATLAGVPAADIAEAVREFRPLEHRLELVGTFGGITYYNDSIATVPQAVIAALDTLGDDVETILLGGADRGLDFSALAQRLIHSGVKNIILFPSSGGRIWDALRNLGAVELPRHFFVESLENPMEEAVELAREHTAKGKICLHSPASPSFGLFRDYRERGEQFKQLVKEATEKQRYGAK